MKIDPKKTVFLIDGSSFLYRAYYGTRPLHTPSGESVQAVYGFCRMIKRLLDTFSPEYLVLVWDSKGKTTRHEMFQEYKATRQAPPNDMFEQKKYIIRFADDIGLVQMQQQGVEADDIMFSIAKERKEAGDTVVFVTSDKDMAQSLDDQTLLYDSFKDEVVDTSAFEAKMGFPVSKLPFYFSLLGDASDNIPGVRGVGKKGALDLVAQFESLDDLYKNLRKVKKIRKTTALQAHQKEAFLSRELFLLQYHPTSKSKKDLAFDVKNWPNARGLFEELNFRSLLRGLPGADEKMIEEKIKKITKNTFITITTRKALEDVCVLLKEKKAFALDTEGSGLRPLQDGFVGISLCVQEGTAYYIPFGHKTEEKQLTIGHQPDMDNEQLGKKIVLDALKPILEDATIEKYLHNVKFDQKVLWSSGIKLTGAVFDSMVAASLLVRDGERVGLKALSERLFDEPMLSFQEMVKDKKLPDFSHVSLELATIYSGYDSHQTFKLHTVLSQELKKEKKLDELYHTIEHPLIQVLFEMEVTGIFVDVDSLKKLGITVTHELAIIEEKIGVLAPESKGINLNSPKQIEQLLFYQLNLPPQKKSTKGTSYSTDQEVLLSLAPLHPVPELLVKHRELSKLKNTYIDALPTYINSKTGRIHTSFNQVGVATGRLASSDPNLQNIPADSSGYGIEVRAAFQPQEGHVFLSADYSQIELRVLAHLSGDITLVNAFLQGHDIHAETAARLFDVALENVTSEQRQVGKRINFSILYGLTPYGLSKDLNISFAQAKKYITTYFEQYPQVSEWMESVIEETKEHGFVATLHGRRRYMPGIYQDNKPLYEEARRVAINTKAQGTAAEIMKIGMINLDRELKKNKLNAQILLQIHDELLISVARDQQDEVERVTKKILESVVAWQVPLVVTTRYGNNWKEVTK